MTETPSNLPAVPDRRREIATIDTDSWVDVMRPILALADKVYDTDFVPKGLRGNAAATAAAMLYAREIRLPPMTGLGMTHVVEGKPGLSAEGMRSLVFAAGHEIEFVESTGGTCTIRGKRRGSDRWTTVTWDIGMARAAGLLGKSNWKNYPRDLLVARATTTLCRMIFPDVIHGFRSVEELEDMSDQDGAAEPATPPGKTVGRKRAAKKTAPKAAPRQLAASDAPAGMPPLPGEAGYEDSSGGDQSEGDAAGEADASPPDDQTGEGGEPAPDAAVVDTPEVGERGPDDDPSSPEAEEPGEANPAYDPGSSPDEPVDAELVETPAGEESPVQEAARENAPPRPISRARQRMLFARLGEFGLDPNDREERLLICSIIVGRELESSNDLSMAEAGQILDTVANVGDRKALNLLLDTIEETRRLEQAAREGDES